MALFAGLGFLASLVVAPRYRAEAVLLLDQNQAKLFDVGPAMSAAVPASNTMLRSEIDILTSRAVLDRVVKKLDLVSDSAFNPKQGFFSKFNLFRFFQSKSSIEATEQEEAERAMTAAADTLQKKLDVSNDGQSFSIRVSFESSDPRRAAEIANTVADEYLVDQLEAKYEIISRANKWLSERLASLRKQVELAEKAVESYRQEANLIQIDGGTVATKQMQEINSQLISARATASQAEARLRNAQAMVRSGMGIEGSTDVLSAPLIQRLREQEASVRRREAELATRYGERHPTMINVRAERRDIQRKIDEEIQKILKSLAGEVSIAHAREDQLQKDLSILETKAGKELKSSVQLRQLQREADANRALYENFLGRFKQTSEQQDMQLPDTRIIARADVPLSPSFPKAWLFIIVGAILGGVSGLLFAYVAEFLDQGFRTAPQLEESTGVPVIGQVPSLTTVSDRPPEDYVVDKPLSAYSEALRTVRTAIHFSNVDNPPKSVMVTSSGPGEGKTTFCLSLARSLATSGNKILLVDADLRRPRVARLLEIAANGKDLSSILTGRRKLEEVLRQDTLVPGLDVIPAFELSGKYDLVIIDTPPILAVTDAAMVARVVDTSLFIVKWAATSRDTVTQAMHQLRGLRCRIAGTVLNQVNMNELASYGDGYYNHRYNEYYTD
jgi:capsular exopolysaccharide synthesis family protein